MSEHWDLRCMDCSEDLGIHANHADKQIQEIIDVAPALIAAAKIWPALTIDLKENFSIYGDGVGHVPVKWFLEHQGHRLAPWSEYKRTPDQCFKTVACPYCRYSGHWCIKPREHEGACDAGFLNPPYTV